MDMDPFRFNPTIPRIPCPRPRPSQTLGLMYPQISNPSNMAMYSHQRFGFGFWPQAQARPQMPRSHAFPNFVNVNVRQSAPRPQFLNPLHQHEPVDLTVRARAGKTTLKQYPPKKLPNPKQPKKKPQAELEYVNVQEPSARSKGVTITQPNRKRKRKSLTQAKGGNLPFSLNSEEVLIDTNPQFPVVPKALVLERSENLSGCAVASSEEPERSCFRGNSIRVGNRLMVYYDLPSSKYPSRVAQINKEQDKYLIYSPAPRRSIAYDEWVGIARKRAGRTLKRLASQDHQEFQISKIPRIEEYYPTITAIDKPKSDDAVLILAELASWRSPLKTDLKTTIGLLDDQQFGSLRKPLVKRKRVQTETNGAVELLGPARSTSPVFTSTGITHRPVVQPFDGWSSLSTSNNGDQSNGFATSLPGLSSVPSPVELVLTPAPDSFIVDEKTASADLEAWFAKVLELEDVEPEPIPLPYNSGDFKFIPKLEEHWSSEEKIAALENVLEAMLNNQSKVKDKLAESDEFLEQHTEEEALEADEIYENKMSEVEEIREKEMSEPEEIRETEMSEAEEILEKEMSETDANVTKGKVEEQEADLSYDEISTDTDEMDEYFSSLD